MNKVFEVYKLQIIQVCSMLIMAFGIPFFIGIDEYGKFASYFSFPGFFLGLAEVFAFTVDSKLTRTNKDFHIYFSITVLSIISVIFISFFFKMNFFFLFFILLPSLLKNWMYGILAQRSQNIINFMVRLEIFYLIGFVLSIFLLFFFNILDYRLPILSYGFSQIFIVLLLIPDYSSLGISHTFKFIFPGFNVLFRRSFEDFFITTMPFFINLNFGNHASGLFRINVSLMKAISKAVPIRYELFKLDFEKSINFKKYVIVFFFLFFLSLILYFVHDLIFYYTALEFNKYLYLIISPAILLLVISPVLSANYGGLIFFNSFSFSLIIVIMSIVSFNQFIISYIISLLFLLLIHLYYVSKSRY